MSRLDVTPRLWKTKLTHHPRMARAQKNKTPGLIQPGAINLPSYINYYRQPG